MTSDHDDILPPEMPLAFDQDGRPCVVTEPAAHDDPEPDECGGLEIEPILDALMVGAPGLEDIGARVVLFAFMMPRSRQRPKCLRELGAWLGCSHTAAAGRLAKLRRILASELRDQLSKAP